MSPQKKTAVTASGGGISGNGSARKSKGTQKENASVATTIEQNNPQNLTAKKHNIANSNVNNNSIDQVKTEKEKPHAKVRNKCFLFFLDTVTLQHTFSSPHYRHIVVRCNDDCLQFS